MSTLHLGSQSEFVRFSVPSSFTGEGWAKVKVEVSAQGFRTTVDAFLERSDFERLLQKLEPLYMSLSGEADLSPIEPQVSLVLVGNGRGGIAVSGHASSLTAFGCKLEFAFEIDQSFLPPFVAELQALLAGSEST